MPTQETVSMTDPFSVYTPGEVEHRIRSFNPPLLVAKAEAKDVTVEELISNEPLYRICRAFAWREQLTQEIAQGERLPDGSINRNQA